MNTKLESLIDAPTPVAEKSLGLFAYEFNRDCKRSVARIDDHAFWSDLASAIRAEVLRCEGIQELREGLDALQIEPVMVPWLTSITKTMTGSQYEETNMPCCKPAIEGRP